MNLPEDQAKAELQNPLGSPPNMNVIKAYLLWRVRVGVSRLQGAKTIAQSTLKKELEQLLRIVKLSNNHDYDRKEKVELKQACSRSSTFLTLTNFR